MNKPAWLDLRHASLLLLLCGCPVPPVARPYPPPTAEQLLQALQNRRDKLASLRAEGRADEMGQGAERVKVPVNMRVARGGRMRLEAESPLGGNCSHLVTDGRQFKTLAV